MSFFSFILYFLIGTVATMV